MRRRTRTVIVHGRNGGCESSDQRPSKQRKLTMLLMSLMMVPAVLQGLSQPASAEYLSPYPDYTYTSSTIIEDNIADPVTILFGGTYDNGYWGSQYGIQDRLHDDIGWNYTSIASHQYVKFISNLGNYVIRQEKNGSNWFEEAKGLPFYVRDHARLFRDKWETSGGSYAEKNCVSTPHHEYFNGTGHTISADFETSEEELLYDLVDANPNNWYSYDVYYNGGYGVDGHFSNGWMSAATLRP